MYKNISKYMIYNELRVYINDLTLSRATKAENKLDTPDLIGLMLCYYREKLYNSAVIKILYCYKHYHFL